MTDQRFYDGPCKVRVLPPGVGQEDLQTEFVRRGSPKNWANIRPPEGYEEVEDAAKRLGCSRTILYHRARRKKIDHVRNQGRIFIAKDARLEPL